MSIHSSVRKHLSKSNHHKFSEVPLPQILSSNVGFVFVFAEQLFLTAFRETCRSKESLFRFKIRAFGCAPAPSFQHSLIVIRHSKQTDNSIYVILHSTRRGWIHWFINDGRVLPSIRSSQQFTGNLTLNVSLNYPKYWLSTQPDLS